MTSEHDRDERHCTRDLPTRRGFSILACAVVLVAAFLLFVLELATAKALLPRFGGSPMVWTGCMLVYQALLLAGYAYAHVLAGRRSATWQTITHTVLLALAVTIAFARLRLDAFSGYDPSAVSRRPVMDLLQVLLGTMALPFAAVSATALLVQHWQQRVNGGRPAYWLYGISNAGSFAALLAYPFLIEPLLGLDRQFAFWTALFSVTALGLVTLALLARRAAAPPEPAPQTLNDAGPRSRGREIALWLALSGGASALLLSATNELCQDLAVFPFLWVVPLALYLLTFTLTFHSRPATNLLAPAAVATVVAVVTTSAALNLPVPVHIASIGSLVFLVCLAAHRELYRLRPVAGRMTAYYLWIALGGILGSMVVALLAPACFTGYWEFQIALLAVWIALIAATLGRDGCLRTGDRRHAAALLGIALYMVLNQVPSAWLRNPFPAWSGNGSGLLRIAAALVLSALLWRILRQRSIVRHAIWPRILAGFVIFLVECSLVQRVRSDRTATHVARNFFGVVRILEVLHPATGIRVRQLTHGRINHGWQYVNPELRPLPTAYHSPSTGIGRLLLTLQARQTSLRVGVTGLGAGALAAYGRDSDHIVFYEIDPQVVRLSAGAEASFGFVNDCGGQTEIVLGDARQSMQAELARTGSRDYDVIALDAFSSDAIPAHLLTREAFSVYLAHLARPGGVLAVNISNRFLDIEPVLSEIAHTFGLHGVLIDSMGDPPVHARSLWVLLSREPHLLTSEQLAAVSRPLTTDRVPWTDTYASPFALLKWWSPGSRRLRLMPERRDPEKALAPGMLPPATNEIPED